MTLSLKALQNPVFHTDVYKLSHKSLEPVGTEFIYSFLTARNNKHLKRVYPNHDGKIVFFGLRPFLILELQQNWNEGFFFRDKAEVMAEVESVLKDYVGMTAQDLEHFSALHDLGYLPLEIKALPEGSIVGFNIPLFTVVNTHPDFSWLTNYIETAISAEVWKPITIATVAREFRKLVDLWFDCTVDDQSGKLFAIHDFSARGHSGLSSAGVCGAAPLLYFNGSDNVPGAVVARSIYNAPSNVALSIPAGEHSVTTLGINYYSPEEQNNELQLLLQRLKEILNSLELSDEYEQAAGELITIYKMLTEQRPTGMLSYVSDSYDYQRTLEINIPLLKDVIRRRDGKFVVRPDSGDPVKIVAGYKVFDSDSIKVEEKDLSSVINLLQVANKALEGSDSTPYDAIKFDEAYYRIKADGSIKSITKAEAEGSIVQLHKTFGGTLNSKGYIELDPTIGLIYGDGITLTRATQIYKQLSEKGYASNCVVDGVGSYTYAGGMLTRDSLSMAIKASYGVVNGQPVNIFKEPKTDTSKRSLKGMLAVFKQNPGEYSVQENCTVEEATEGLLTTVFKDSTVTQTQTFEDIQKLALEI